MRLNDALKVSARCYCNRVDVEIPVSWVSEGKTGSCSPGCGPGCVMVPDEPEPDEADPVRMNRKWKMNKYSPARYDPQVDSTPGLPARADAVSLVAGSGLCACGCGDNPAGRKAKFCMGHDARLKGVLMRAFSAGIDIALYEQTTGTAEVIDPLTYADRFSTEKVDWRKLVTDAADRVRERRGGVDRRAAERRVLERAAKDGAVRVGKWDKTDSVAAIYDLGDGKVEIEFVDEVGRVRNKVVESGAA